jgi:hypothetical protein
LVRRVSERPKRKIQDVIHTIEKAIETRNLVNVLTMLENIAKEAGAYVKFKPEDILALLVEQLPYGGVRVEVVMRNGIAIVYDLFRGKEDYVEAQLYVRRV